MVCPLTLCKIEILSSLLNFQMISSVNGYWTTFKYIFILKQIVDKKKIQTLEDMLRACALNYVDSWDINSPLVELGYNSSYHASIGMAPFEALYRWCCRKPVCWHEVGEREPSKVELIDQTNEVVKPFRKDYKQLRINKTVMWMHAEGCWTLR